MVGTFFSFGSCKLICAPLGSQGAGANALDIGRCFQETLVAGLFLLHEFSVPILFGMESTKLTVQVLYCTKFVYSLGIQSVCRASALLTWEMGLI